MPRFWGTKLNHYIEGQHDILVQVQPMLEATGDWKGYRALDIEEEEAAMRRHERTRRPLGSEGFIELLEKLLDRVLLPQKRGPKGPWKHKLSLVSPELSPNGYTRESP